MRHLARDRRGAAAVEFALVCMCFIPTLLFIMFVALIVYQDESLDFAASKAARQIMTGQVQQGALSQAAFRTQVLCPYLPALMNCSNVIINVQTVTEGAQPAGYYTLVNANATALNMPPLIVDAGSYSVGVAGSYEYLQVIYPVTFFPSLIAKALGSATYNGAPAYLLVSTAAFKNEQYQ